MEEVHEKRIRFSKVRDKVRELTNNESEISSMLIGEAQLILAEKRTSLSVMRSGVAVMALPITVLSFLIATSRYYELLKVLHLLIPLFVLLLILTFFGIYLIIKSLFRMRHYDKLLQKIKMKNSIIAEFID